MQTPDELRKKGLYRTADWWDTYGLSVEFTGGTARAFARNPFDLLDDSVTMRDELIDRIAELEAELIARYDAQTTGWYCPTCAREVDPLQVTNDERHETCGTYIGDAQTTEGEGT